MYEIQKGPVSTESEIGFEKGLIERKNENDFSANVTP